MVNCLKHKIPAGVSYSYSMVTALPGKTGRSNKIFQGGDLYETMYRF